MRLVAPSPRLRGEGRDEGALPPGSDSGLRPLPARRGEENKIAFSRCVFASELCHATRTRPSQSSPPRIAVRRTASCGRLCRWSMQSSSRQTLGGKRYASVSSAWIAGSSPAMTNGTNGNERKRFGGETPTDAIDIQPGLTGPAAPPIGGRPSIGVPPRLWLRRPNATTQLQFRATRDEAAVGLSPELASLGTAMLLADRS